MTPNDWWLKARAIKTQILSAAALPRLLLILSGVKCDTLRVSVVTTFCGHTNTSFEIQRTTSPSPHTQSLLEAQNSVAARVNTNVWSTNRTSVALLSMPWHFLTHCPAFLGRQTGEIHLMQEWQRSDGAWQSMTEGRILDAFGEAGL